MGASQVGLAVKNSPANAGDIRDTGSIPGSGRCPGGGHGNTLQYFCLENPRDRGAWWATVHGAAKSQTRLKQLSMHARTHTHTQRFFLPRSKRLLISWLQSSSTVILETKKTKSVTTSTFFPSICHEVMGLDAMILVFWTLSFNPGFLLSSFTFIKRLFIHLLPLGRYHLHVWGCWFFSWQSWFQLMIHPAWPFSWCPLHVLGNQGGRTQPCCPPFPILNQPVVPRKVLLC